jgi:hypothetical protein
VGLQLVRRPGRLNASRNLAWKSIVGAHSGTAPVLSIQCHAARVVADGGERSTAYMPVIAQARLAWTDGSPGHGSGLLEAIGRSG